jgi:lipopolysaccharide transport system ATP-binding protein
MPTNQEQSTMNQEPSKLPERQDEVLVKVEGVSKKFCRDLKKSLWYGMCDVASELLPFSSNKEPRTKNQEHSPSLRDGEFWANKDISFELRRGECIGLIGRNGAGKTTLLKMLNGLIKPDSGTIEMRGRVGALIALGAGFNPILTGRENIYVNGSILGLTKEEIDSKMEDIIEFAEIREFMDSPVQSYSSGMQVRLGFAVATALNPDILILDEVLAVGDAAFRAKCYNRIGKLQKDAAVIFVSHSMHQVSQVCSAILMLHRGVVAYNGDVAGGVNAYNKDNITEGAAADGTLILEHPVREAALSFAPESLDYGNTLSVRLMLDLADAMPNSTLRISFYSEKGLIAGEWNSRRTNTEIHLPKGRSILELQVGPTHLGPGEYKLAVALTDHTGVSLPYWSLKQHSISIKGSNIGACEYQIPNTGILSVMPS